MMNSTDFLAVDTFAADARMALRRGDTAAAEDALHRMQMEVMELAVGHAVERFTLCTQLRGLLSLGEHRGTLLPQESLVLSALRELPPTLENAFQNESTVTVFSKIDTIFHRVDRLTTTALEARKKADSNTYEAQN
jgi:hypothetical protein